MAKRLSKSFFRGVRNKILKKTGLKSQMLKNQNLGSSVVAYWLEYWAFTDVSWVQSLVRELRYHRLYGMAKKKKNSKIETTIRKFRKVFDAKKNFRVKLKGCFLFKCGGKTKSSLRRD